MKIYLESPRLILREIVETDIEDLFELDSDPEVHRYLGNQPVTDIQQMVGIIQDIRQQYKENGIGRWAAIEKESGAFIGWSGLKYETILTNGRTGYYDLGYRLKRKYWRQGYGSESALASLRYGFEVLKWDEICGAAHVENIGSNKILQKVGLKFVNSFYYEEDKCNWYQLSREEWLRKEEDR